MDVSPRSISGAASRIRSMSACSIAAACSNRRSDDRSTPTWTKAVSAVSSLAIPTSSRSWSAFRTPSEFRPEAAINSSVLMPSSASASISVSQIFSNCRRYSTATFLCWSLDCASATEPTRSDDGNTCTRFSSRVSSTASSSQATAVRKRVSSVAESRSKTLSSSSVRISPEVAITSPSVRFLRSRFRRALRTP